jgi:hypothetical protein
MVSLRSFSRSPYFWLENFGFYSISAAHVRRINENEAERLPEAEAWHQRILTGYEGAKALQPNQAGTSTYNL